MSIKEKQDRLPTLYWLLKLHKRTYKARFIANSSSCTTTVLSKLLTKTAVKNIGLDTMILFTKGTELTIWSIKNSNEVLNKFKSKNFKASKLSTYDFSTVYTTLPHQLIKDKLIDLINRTFIRENTQYLACNEECAFFTADDSIITIYGLVKTCVMLLFIFCIIFLLDLELNFICKLFVFRWELIVLLLLQICFYIFVKREIS